MEGLSESIQAVHAYAASIEDEVKPLHTMMHGITESLYLAAQRLNRLETHVSFTAAL